MNYPPYGHRREEEEEEDKYPPRGPPFHNAPPSNYSPYPPPPQFTQVSHSSHMAGGDRYDYPPNQAPHGASGFAQHVSHESPIGGGDRYDYPPPQNTQFGGNRYEYPSQETYPPHGSSGLVHHVSHESPVAEPENNPHHFRPHMPSFIHHHDHYNNADVAARPTVRMYSKADPNYSLSISEGTVVLARSNPSDPFQHWVKDEKYSTKVKDEQGYPSFALVNKATGEALKHSIGATHPVQLASYDPKRLDESVLWTESKDLGDSYRTIRMVNNIRLNIDALNGDKNHGGVHDGTKIVLWEWKKGENQRWKIVPY